MDQASGEYEITVFPSTQLTNNLVSQPSRTDSLYFTVSPLYVQIQQPTVFSTSKGRKAMPISCSIAIQIIPS
jgi:hypothetical protein